MNRIKIIIVLTLLIGTFIRCSNNDSNTTVGVFYNYTLGPITFAAEEVKKALNSRGFEVEMLSLSELSIPYTNKKIVIALESNTTVKSTLTNQSGTLPTETEKQAYSLRTTRATVLSHWSLGGDAVGAMYGGLDIAESIKLYGLNATVEGNHSPTIKNRGIKYHFDADARTPSYSGAGTSAQESIEYNWDMQYWKDYLDIMARQRLNTIFLWSLNPFPSMVKVSEYPKAALDNVYRTTTLMYPDGRGGGMSTAASLANLELVKTITIEEKVEFWREVMQYAADRGVGFYFQTWMTYTYGTETSYPELTNFMSEPNTDYFFHTAKAFLKTYPLVKGLGGYPGEKMKELETKQKKQNYLFATYGKAINAVLADDLDRDLEYIAGKGTLYGSEIDNAFSGLNGPYNYDVKYTRSKMISVVKSSAVDDLYTRNGRKFWLLFRDDDNYMFRWGDPVFMKGLFENVPLTHVKGVQLGANLIIYGRESGEKDPFAPRQIFLEKHWFKCMMFGRYAYDPTIPVQRFKDMVANRFEEVPGTALYDSWVAASRIRQLVNSFNHKGNGNDYTFVLENNYSREINSGYKERFTGFVPIKHFAEARPHENSGMTSIKQYVSGDRNGMTPDKLADNLDELADQALNLTLDDVTDKETRKTISDIHCLAQLGYYYADKIRAALNYELGKKEEALNDASNAACQWKDYAFYVDKYYDPVRLTRMLNPTKDSDNGYVSIPKLQDQANLDYRDLGGVGIPDCSGSNVVDPNLK